MDRLGTLSQFLLALCLGSVVLVRAASPPITNCLDVLNLSPEQAAENHPVRIRGTVTCYVPSSQLCFVQDGTAGVYVFPSPWPKVLSAGQVVEIEGVTGPGRFSPILQWGRIRPTGEEALVEAKSIAIEELNSGRYDCQFVELEGVVQEVADGGDVLKMQIFTGGSSAEVLVFKTDESPANVTSSANPIDRGSWTDWIDARVRVRGVAGTFYDGDQLSGFGVFLPDRSSVTILEKSTDPFTRPLRTTRKLAWFSPDGALDHRIHLRGLVTVSWPEKAFFLQDAFGAIRISTDHGQPKPQPGDVIEVAGFLRDATGRTPELAGAVWKKVASAPLPQPKVTALTEVLAKPAHGQLVSTEGTVISARSAGGIMTLLLEDAGQGLNAVSRGALPKDLIGAEVSVTGAFSGSPDAGQHEKGPAIWLGTTNHLVVLQRPRPVLAATPQRAGAILAAGCGGILLLGALAIRGQVRTRRAVAEKRAATERLNTAEKEVHQLKGARERLGRDLHDHIIQSIYAVGLNVEDCRLVLNEPAKAEPRLRTTLADINGIIRELRNVILGLETNAIQPQEFRTALKSLALTLGDEKSNRVRLDMEQSAVDQFSAAQATELVHIAREAMSNSVRHGKALTTTFSLRELPSCLQFTIEDDGCGFNPASGESKGFGLRNMAKRAGDIGATFTVQSEEGAGTRIVLDIPKQKQHFSSSESRARIDR